MGTATVGAVGLCARAQLRRGTRGIGLMLVLGLAGGAAIGLEAGARRSDSAYSRFLDAQRAADVFIPNYPDPELPGVDVRTVAGLPQVAALARVKQMYIPVGTSETDETAGEVLIAYAPADGAYGTTIDRPRVIRGRLANPGRVDEVTMGFAAAERIGIDVGARIPLVDFEGPSRGVPPTTLTVVGIVARPGEFPPQALQGALGLHLTPAFYRERAAALNINTADGLDGAVVRLRPASSVPAFRRAVEALAGGAVLIEERAKQTDDVRRSLHMQALGLRVLAVFIGLTTLMILGHAMAREAFIRLRDLRTLRALGMGRMMILGTTMVPVGVRAALAASVAGVVAAALSPMFPRGLARMADPASGLVLDVPLMVTAAGLGIGVAVGATAVSTVRMLSGPDARDRRTSMIAETLARAGSSPAMVMGVRAAFDRGAGAGSVPVRSSLLVATIGIVAMVATATFGASASRLTREPALYGIGWDMVLAKDGEPSLFDEAGLDFLRKSRSIERASVGDETTPVRIDGLDLVAFTYQVVKGGGVLPVVATGRAPIADDEVFLGVRTMRQLGLRLGDYVDVQVIGRDRVRRMIVVGSGILPAQLSLGASSRQSDGAAMLRTILPAGYEEVGSSAYVDLAPGTRRVEVLRDLVGALGDGYEGLTPPPDEIANFGRMEELPVLITVVMAALAVATTTHVVVATTRRRRRDFALLRALGFRARDVITSVSCHGSAFMIAALLLGVPLGFAVGRLVWTGIAEEVGVLPSPTVSVAFLGLLGPSGILVGLLAGLIPAAMTSRGAPAADLRSE